MIYQFYFAEHQKEKLFANPLYRGFGLEPEVNPSITLNCPELERPEHRATLVSYGGLLHLWRNQLDDHDWIGFTSYRQLDKVPTIFLPGDLERIQGLLQTHEFVGWNYMTFNSSLAVQAEAWHPGILSYMGGMASRTGLTIPWEFFTHRSAFFAEYWIMKKETLGRFMTWLHPFILDGLDRLLVERYLGSNNHLRSLGNVLERLFVIWCYLERVRCFSWQHSKDMHYPEILTE